MIPKGHRDNFETLRQAFLSGSVCLMEWNDRESGKQVHVICAVNTVDDEYEIVPFVRFFDGNPYDELVPPMAEGQLP